MKRAELRKMALETFLREGDNVSQRIDWSLIFHGILLEAFATAVNPHVSLWVGTFGLVTAYLWFWIGARQNWHMRYVHRCITAAADPDDAVYRFQSFLTSAHTEGQPQVFKWVRAVPIFTIVIPGATFLTWLILLSSSILDYRAKWVWWLLVPLALGAATFVAARVKDQPLIRETAVNGLYENAEK